MKPESIDALWHYCDTLSTKAEVKAFMRMAWNMVHVFAEKNDKTEDWDAWRRLSLHAWNRLVALFKGSYQEAQDFWYAKD